MKIPLKEIDDIVVTEIKEEKKNFKENINKVKNFLNNRYKNLSKNKSKRKNYETSMNVITDTKAKLNMSIIIYNKIFGVPEDGKYDEKKIKIIEDSIKRNKM